MYIQQVTWNNIPNISHSNVFTAKLIGLVSVFSAYIFSASPSFKVSIYREPMVLKDGR